jgi:hypothetical protein
MRELGQAESSRDRIRLVVVNDKPRHQEARRDHHEPSDPEPTRARFIDQRFLDLAALIFTIGLAFLLAYLIGSLNHADQRLLCLLAGGQTCN